MRGSEVISKSRLSRSFALPRGNAVVPGGLLTNALGVTIDVGLLNRWGISWLRWDSSVSGWFYVAWAVVVCVLAVLDWKSVPKGSP